MKFGEKLRQARKKAGLSQAELAEVIGVSSRTISNYESAEVYPKKREHYYKMAEVLGVDVNYLMTDSDLFITEAYKRYGSRGAKQAEKLVDEIAGLFAGGELADDDMDIMMRSIQEAYWLAKDKNKKFTPKKYGGKQ